MLIQEQLKSFKLFVTLSHLGIEAVFYQANLIELIMSGVGLSIDSKVDYGFCYCLLMKHSHRIVEDADELYDEAARVYRLLVARATPEASAGDAKAAVPALPAEVPSTPDVARALPTVAPGLGRDVKRSVTSHTP
jgi:hypothetical protein